MFHNSRVLVIGLAVLAAFGLTLTTQRIQAANIAVWDGSGSPADSGFVLTGSATQDKFVFDSDDGTPGSAPGMMYQIFNAGETKDKHWDFLADDLNHTDGWFIEERFQVITAESTG